MDYSMFKKNYRRFITVLAVASLFVTDLYAQDGLGVGAIVGEPSGVSVKYWIDKNNAFDAAFAWSLADNSPFQIHADYLIHGASLIGNSSDAKGRLPWYCGIGGRIKNINNESHFGVRAPFGVTYLLSEVPVDIFGEITPVLDVKPTINVNWNGALGIRYYFK